MNKLSFIFLSLSLILTQVSCDNVGGEIDYNNPNDPLGTNYSSGTDPSSVAPVMNALVITASDSSSITLSQPTFGTAGSPVPIVAAYIGVSGTITISGSSVNNYEQGPIDASSGDCTFTGLSANTTYKIVVIAQNTAGYSVQSIIQSTASIAPVMNNLVITASDLSSITLGQPTFSTAGNPIPVVRAYIGIDGTITVSGSTVSNSTQGPVSVATSTCQFSSLSTNTTYRIIVVAENSQGYSVKQIVQSTAAITPVLNALSISSFDATTITLAQPTFSIAGNPTPTVLAYLGLSASISVTATSVSSYLQGPVNVATSSKQFTSLSAATAYKIIVVAENSAGYSVQQITQSTTSTVPVLNPLVISASDASSITLDLPTFFAGGNPAPTVNAFLGVDGIIFASGTNVFGATQGPFDVSAAGRLFSGLSTSTMYRIIVVATNAGGSSVQQTTLYVYNSTALRVYGQGGSFITNTSNNGGISANSLNTPYRITVTSTGVYIADGYNNRVLYYSGTSTTATRVYGQGGSFTTSTPNNGGISANSLYFPQSIAIDSNGIYIAEPNNNRVLYYSGTSTTAIRVYGQGGSFTTNTANNGGTSENSLFAPFGVAVDSSGVYIADRDNNRVLYYTGTSTTATRVYGQGGSFSTATPNNGGLSANSLYEPNGVSAYGSGVYISDRVNNRVLYFSGTSTTATRVYGQGGNFATSTYQTVNGVNSNSLTAPYEVVACASGVFIAAYSSHRVLYYPGTSTTAIAVYGQGRNFTTYTMNKGGLSADSLNNPSGVSVDSNGRLYIVDRYNHRCLFY